MSDVILLGKQALFVALYVENEARPDAEKLPGYQIAVNAGVAPKNAAKYATEAVQNPKIAQAIADRKRKLADEAAGLCDVDAKRVLQDWAHIATADPTDVITVRRVNCRHCWGEQHRYQWTAAEYAMETAEAMQDAFATGREADLSRFAGGTGFRFNREPCADCPECAGEGVEDVHIKDLRKLRGPARKLIAGVRQGKFGVEVLFRDQDAALLNLARWLGLVVNKNEHAGPNGGPIPTANLNYDLPADPMEAARVYQRFMEGTK